MAPHAGATSRLALPEGWERIGRLAAPAFVAGWLLAVYGVVRATGGTPNPLANLDYIAIVVAATRGGWRGGAIAGAAAGLLLGPLMADSNAASPGLLGAWGWQVRYLVYVAAGVLVGALCERSQRMVGELRAAEERGRGAASLKASERRLRQLVDGSPIGIVMLDADGQVTVANAAAHELLGTIGEPVVEAGGRVPLRAIPPNGERSIDLGEVAMRVLRADRPLSGIDFRVDRGDGTYALLSTTVAPIHDDDGRSAGAVVTLHDVTAERLLERQREARFEELQRAASVAAAEPTARAAGERLLGEFARVWPVVSAVIYVFEGECADRLAAWTEAGLDLAYPSRVSEAETARLRELAGAGHPVRLGLERVVADPAALQVIERHGGRTKLVVPLLVERALVGVLLAADRRGPAMLAAAENAGLEDFGRISAAVVERAQAGEEAEERRARARIGAVLERSELLVPAFQPIVSLAERRIVGYEALARFAVEPIEPPNAWFELADRCGLGPDIHALALHRAVEVALAAGLPRDAFLSVNVSPRLLANRSLMRAMRRAPWSQLVLELTEDEAIGDYASVRSALAPYRARGARLAIDDTGAGHASLRHVVELRPDFIKLDALLTAGVSGDLASRAAIRAVHALASEIGAVLIAEGVERVEDLSLLAEPRPPILAQGYAIARPGAPWPQILPQARRALDDAGRPRGRVGIRRRHATPEKVIRAVTAER